MRKLQYAEVAITNLYVDSVDEKKLVEDAIRGMIDKLDPHSSYLTPKEVKSLNEPLNGNFEGIGVQFNMIEDTLLVIQPVTNGPSERVGIIAGDRIAESLDAVHRGARLRMLQDRYIPAAGMALQMAGALDAGQVIVRLDRSRHGIRVLIGHARIDADDRHAHPPSLVERRCELAPVDRIDEQHLHARREQIANLLDLPLDGQRRIARQQHIAPLLDRRTDLLIDDFIERIVQRHIDGPEFMPLLTLAG